MSHCMTRKLRNVSACMAIAALSLMATSPAEALKPRASSDQLDFHFGRDIALVGVGLGAAVILTVYLVRRGHHLTGCAASSPNGLLLVTNDGHQTYALAGEVSAIKPGDRFHVSGKKEAKVAAGTRTFLVSKVSRDLGPCPATP